MGKEEKNKLISEKLDDWANNADYSAEKIEQDIKILKEVYSEGYIQSYADITTIVQRILEDDIEKGEPLCKNLQSIKKTVEERALSEKIPMCICANVFKLCDCVNLEVGHYRLFVNKISQTKTEQQKAVDRKLDKDEIDKVISEEIRKRSPKMDDLLYEVKRNLGQVDEKLEKNSLSSITSLTIFSAVILSFTGSMTFTSDIFSEISSASIYRIVFVASVVGIILFDLIFMLLFVVGRMVGKEVCCSCGYLKKSEDSNFSNNKCGQGTCIRKNHIPNIGCVLTHKYPYILAVNVIFALIMYYDTLLFLANNREQYLSLFNSADVWITICFLLPGILAVGGIGFKYLWYLVLYRRNITAISLDLAKQFFNEKYGDKTFGSLLARSFSSVVSSMLKTDTIIIADKISDLLECQPMTKTKQSEYLIRRLSELSKEMIAKKERDMEYITIVENHQNKYLLKKVTKDILDRYEQRHDPENVVAG